MDIGETQVRRALLEILDEAEKKCTDVILDAVRAKNQEGMELAGEVTIRLREIIDELRRAGSDTDRKAIFRESPDTAGLRRRIRKGEYPKFHVEDGCLVKVGWSKKAKKEYAHKVPKEVYGALLDLIARRAAESGEYFTAEEILQAREHLTQTIPDYHVYVALAFLQDRGILDKNGRRGYRAVKDIKEAGVTAWQDMAAN